MSLADVQQRPAVIERINPSRYLISWPPNAIVPRSAHNLSSLQAVSGNLPESSTGARFARKRSHPSTAYAWATSPSTTSPQSSHSTSPVNPPVQPSELVKLGIIDFKTVIRSNGVTGSPVQTTTNARKTSPPSNAITPPTGNAPSLPLLATPSSRPQNIPTVKSTVPRFQIPITPRPGPRLPIFHPDNTTALPEISRPSLLFIPNGPSPPPARRTTRARKPAAKAIALSLGLGSDGSGLDGIETLSTDHNNINGGKGDRTSTDVTPVPAPLRSHKKKVVHRDEEPGVPEAAAAAAGVSEGSAPKLASRRPPKRKAAAQAAEVMIVDFANHDLIDQDDASRLGVPPAKRARRGAGPDQQHTAATHAPSPLANELARAEASPPPTLPPSETSMAVTSNPKKRKAETPSSESVDADADASVASPPPAVRPKITPSSGRPRSSSNSKSTQAKSKSSKKSDDGSKSSARSGSSSAGGDSGSEDKQMELDAPKPKPSAAEPNSVETKDDNEEDDDDDDDEPPRRSYNMFEEPLELKPRPRPTYKAHLKRLSTSSYGEDRPSRPRASKSKKSGSSSGSSRSHSRKESEDVQQQQQQQFASSLPISTSPETEVRTLLSQGTAVSTVTDSSIKSDAMDLDTPTPIIPQTGSALGVSIAV